MHQSKEWATHTHTGKSLHHPRPLCALPLSPSALLLFQDATLPLMVLSAVLERSTEGRTNHTLSAPDAASCGAKDEEVSRSP